MQSPEATLLRAVLATIARQTFAPSDILGIVAPVSTSERGIEIYNLCDGTRSQAAIAKETGYDRGNLSKLLRKWVDEGIIIKISDERGEVPVHVYPLSDSMIRDHKRVKSK